MTHSRGVPEAALDRARSIETTSKGPCVYAGFSAKNRQHYIIPSSYYQQQQHQGNTQSPIELGSNACVNRRRFVSRPVRRTTVCPAVVDRNLNHSRNNVTQPQTHTTHNKQFFQLDHRTRRTTTSRAQGDIHHSTGLATGQV